MIDDSNELLPYRTAVFGLLAGTIFIAGWLYQSGIQDIRVLVLFLFAAFVIFLGMTRIVVEGGLVFLRCPLVPQPFVSYTLGTTTIPQATMTALTFTYVWCADVKSPLIAAAAHGEKLRETVGIGRRTTLIAIVLATVIAIIVSIVYTLHVGYQYGAYNLGTWSLGGGVRYAFDYLVGLMKNPVDADPRRLSFLGIGVVTMVLLTFLRYRFLWWPLHPIGFTIAGTLPIIYSAFSVFLAWVAKFTIIRVGGMRGYLAARPFFFGLITGHFTGVGISFLIDMIWFYGRGHGIYGW